MAELHLTVDTQIVLIGNGMSDLVRTTHHESLMRYFSQDAFLALDHGGQIRAEYERKMGAESEGRKWLANLALHDRVRMHELAKLPTKVRVELDKEHFHQTDRKFVRLAISTESKSLVAEDADYSDRVRKVLKKHAMVRIHNAEEACGLIAASRDVAKPEP